MIELRNVSKNFGAAPAVADFSLKIESGAFFVLVGPSGCGKSTVLRMINAMIVPDKGQIEVRGQDIRAMEPEKLRRGIGYVIQSAGLFPHWTAADNILAVPRLLKWSPSQCAARLDALVAMLRIDPALALPLPEAIVGRSAATHRRCPRAGRRSRHHLDGRALRGARSGEPGRRCKTNFALFMRKAARRSFSSRMTWTKPCGSPPAWR